ncbi:MAG: hypothetical protein Q8Q01_04245 [archaeon]|nr:hypothetical protein [archaeon]
MATILDVSLLNTVGIIFPILIVWAVTWAILRKTKWLGNAPAIDAVIASAVSLIVLISPKLVHFLNFIIPWFAVAIIFFILLLLVFRIFGAEEKDFANAVRNSSALMWTLIAMGLLILTAGIFSTVGQDFTNLAFDSTAPVESTTTGGVATSSFDTNIANILVNPKILGVMIVFAILVFAVALLTGSDIPK